MGGWGVQRILHFCVRVHVQFRTAPILPAHVHLSGCGPWFGLLVTPSHGVRAARIWVCMPSAASRLPQCFAFDRGSWDREASELGHRSYLMSALFVEDARF